MDEWDQVVKTNLTGTWLVSKYVCIRMRDAERAGSIINISSIAGLNRGQLPGGAAYSSSKAGLNALTKVISFDLQFLENMEALSLTCFLITVWKQNGYFTMEDHTFCEPESCIIISDL